MLLIRVDPSRKMNRWYRITVQATFFDPWNVVCEWGSRCTAYQRFCIIPAENPEDAWTLANQIAARKLRRGYHLASGCEMA
jgi:predicted DNA-binding WGR domain protein